VDLLLLAIGSAVRPDTPDRLARAGAQTAESVAVERVTADATPAAVDAALTGRAGRRLVIEADLAGLTLVLNRLMRRDELADAETAVLATGPIEYLTRLGLPTDGSGQLRTAVLGRPRLAGVIKTDSGGLLVDTVSLGPDPVTAGDCATSGRVRRPEVAQSAAKWWLRAVVDDQRLSDGPAGRLDVRHLGPAELEATVTLPGRRVAGVPLGRSRTRTCRGRSLQLACDPALIIEDGRARERPRSKRTFWSEPELWRLALPG